MNDREKWEARYGALGRVDPNEPETARASGFLAASARHLPDTGLALDIAAGEGWNSMFLARKGLQVIALDIALNGLRRLAARAKAQDLPIFPAVMDLAVEPLLPPNRFDVIINFNYLSRAIAGTLPGALKPGGVLVFETVTLGILKLKPEFNEKYLLQPGELRTMFGSLRVLEYRELESAKRPVASLAAVKPW